VDDDSDDDLPLPPVQRVSTLATKASTSRTLKLPAVPTRTSPRKKKAPPPILVFSDDDEDDVFLYTKRKAASPKKRVTSPKKAVAVLIPATSVELEADEEALPKRRSVKGSGKAVTAGTVGGDEHEETSMTAKPKATSRSRSAKTKRAAMTEDGYGEADDPSPPKDSAKKKALTTGRAKASPNKAAVAVVAVLEPTADVPVKPSRSKSSTTRKSKRAVSEDPSPPIDNDELPQPDSPLKPAKRASRKRSPPQEDVNEQPDTENSPPPKKKAKTDGVKGAGRVRKGAGPGPDMLASEEPMKPKKRGRKAAPAGETHAEMATKTRRAGAKSEKAKGRGRKRAREEQVDEGQSAAIAPQPDVEAEADPSPRPKKRTKKESEEDGKEVKAATKRATTATGKAVQAKPARTAKTKSVAKGKENRSEPASGPVKVPAVSQVAKVVKKVRFVCPSPFILASLLFVFRHLSPLSRRNSFNRSQAFHQGVSR
jgi:hypothetical protein